MAEEKTRNQLQYVAFTVVFDILTRISLASEIDVKSLVSDAESLPYEECDLFVKEVAIETIKHINDATKALNENMERWTIDRRNRTIQAILILSYIHFYYVDTAVDKKVVIDIAIRLSKTYGDDRDYKFVNAVLDKALQR
ncbi:MAG: hypothetical protein IJ247_01845 [Bacilli bacterium]|nr:hypothetical protein [Bacilli bacterium]